MVCNSHLSTLHEGSALSSTIIDARKSKRTKIQNQRSSMIEVS
jgi:hypothetical protein